MFIGREKSTLIALEPDVLFIGKKGIIGSIIIRDTYTLYLTPIMLVARREFI